MLASFDPASIIVPLSLAVFFLFSLLAKRGQKRLKSWLEVRDGQVVLREDVRLKLERRHPERLRRLEAMIEKSYAVDGRGEIAARGGEEEAAEPKPSDVPTDVLAALGVEERRDPAPAREADRFRSVWEEQDDGPSIWDEKDKADFWGSDREKGG